MTKPEDISSSASPTSSANREWVSASQQALLDLEQLQRYVLKSSQSHGRPAVLLKFFQEPGPGPSRGRLVKGFPKRRQPLASWRVDILRASQLDAARLDSEILLMLHEQLMHVFVKFEQVGGL